MRDSNAHRKDKRNFQAFLTPSEAAVVDKAKKAVSVSTDRELIVLLATGACR